MDELVRAIEATLFASATPLTVEELHEHVGDGDIEVGLGKLAAIGLSAPGAAQVRDEQLVSPQLHLALFAGNPRVRQPLRVRVASEAVRARTSIARPGPRHLMTSLPTRLRWSSSAPRA